MMFKVMMTRIMVVILIEEDLSLVTSLLSVIVPLAGKLHFNLLLHCLQLKQNIFQQHRALKRLFGFEVWSMNLVLHRVFLLCFVTTRVLFI